MVDELRPGLDTFAKCIKNGLEPIEYFEKFVGADNVGQTLL